MVLEDLEIPQFSDLKPFVVDAAVRKNPAKWRERNKRRAQSRKAKNREPTWEVQQVAVPEVDAELDLKKDVAKEIPKVPSVEVEKTVEDAVAVGPVDDLKDEQVSLRRRGQTMPGGYYVRSLEEMHMQTMRAFNVRLSKPYQRPARAEEEEIPPLEPEDEKVSLRSALAEKLRQSQEEVFQREQKKREEEEAEKRREAERRCGRRLLEVKIRKLREEQAQDQARKEAERKKKREEVLEAAKAAARRERKEKEKQNEKAEALKLQREKDALEDAKLREERRKRQAEEAARRERATQRAEALREEQRRQELEAEKRREEEERQREAAIEAERLRVAQEEIQREEVVDPEEEARREEVEKEERRKRAERRRKEIKEKAERAKKAAAAGLPPSLAAQQAAEQMARERQPAEVLATVAVLGHQGSGKSTLVGALLLATGTINERELVKRRKDLERFPCDELQREEGLRTPSGAELTLLDVPGGRRCLPQAVQAAAEADVALLAVSAKGRELEAALREASGTSTLAEQLRVAKGLGTRRLVVAVTKMEEVAWSSERLDEVTAALAPLLTNAGFQQAAVTFVPVDALSNQLESRKADSSLLRSLDEAAHGEPRLGAVQVLIFESFATNTGKGLRVRGRVEQGVLRPGRLKLAPGQTCVVENVSAGRELQPLREAKAGHTVELQLAGSLPDWPSTAGATLASWRGAVLCSEEDPVQVSDYVKAQMEVIELPRPLTAGFRAILHVHAATVEAEVEKILDAFDWATGITTEKPKVVKAGQRLTVNLRLSREIPLCAAEGSRLSLGMLRLDETTVATGRILEVQ